MPIVEVVWIKLKAFRPAEQWSQSHDFGLSSLLYNHGDNYVQKWWMPVVKTELKHTYRLQFFFWHLWALIIEILAVSGISDWFSKVQHSQLGHRAIFDTSRTASDCLVLVNSGLLWDVYISRNVSYSADIDRGNVRPRAQRTANRTF